MNNPACRHPYVTAVGKAGQKTLKPARAETETMLGCCKKWAVDQEIVLPEEIETLAGKVLDMAALSGITHSI